MAANNQEKQNIVSRPPVVVILGHVDSGKTSLLDFIRQSHVTQKESGGITQHIGAYQIEKSGKKITFIDTPGHEAFSAMRQRGAKVADIAVLVIDGVEGVQPQTREAIGYIKAANIPFIVAINKTDRMEANPEKIKNDLIKEDVLPESLGGKIPSINISAKTGQGVSELLEVILLLGEMEGLKSDISKPADGLVIESFLDQKRGQTAVVIISEGILKTGDIIGTFSASGKVKILEDFQGAPIEKALPADPAIIIGFAGVPALGETFKVFQESEQVKNYLKSKEKTEIPEKLEPAEGQKVLNLILKSDVAGSLEAISEVLKEIPQDKVILNTLESGVGEINESDVKLAKSTRAVISGFRVKINSIAKQIAERDKIKIMTFDIIYDLVEGIRKFMEKIILPEDVRTDLGKVKILAVFLAEKNRQIVGGRVVSGEIKKGALVEIIRNEEIVGRGKMINLQKNKKDAERVIRGEECGILYEGDAKIETGDTLAIYIKEKKKGQL